MGRVRLTWSLAPHSPAEEVAGRTVAVMDPAPSVMARVAPSPPGAANRRRAGQGLLLSRTMLSNQQLPYVGRFACDWLRLATTDPHAAHDPVYAGVLRETSLHQAGDEHVGDLVGPAPSPGVEQPAGPHDSLGAHLRLGHHPCEGAVVEF
jgi:hypothetical protein